MITFKRFYLSDYADSLIVTDSKLSALYGIQGENVYILPQGEQSKRFEEAEKLCRWFLSKNLLRKGKVAAVGGGSVGDSAGFACSVYKRGDVKLTHVPTTLISQIDSAIGGKTALDLGNVKNAVGTFFAADTVIDVGFLKTLDELQLTSGLGELFKYRMLSKKVDGVYCGEVTEEVIKTCVEYKQKICAADPFDDNVRKKLNFGHTLGHAMEILLGIPHGVAVANGLYYETMLAYKLNKCDKAYCDEWTCKIAERFSIYPLNAQILSLTAADKKNGLRGICFMLPPKFDENYLPLDTVSNLLC